MNEEMLNKGFIKHNNFKLEKQSNNDWCLSTELTEDSLNPYGFAHGGLIFSLADTIMGLKIYLLGHKAVTVDANINYLKKAQGHKLYATAEVVKEGSSICVLRANIYDENNTLIAVSTSTYYFTE